MEDVEQQVKDFFADFPVERLSKGQLILRPGDKVEKVSYLVSGSVVQYDISPAGNVVIVNAYKPKTFFPMSSVLNHRPSDYFFETNSEATIIQAPANKIIEFLDKNPVVTMDLLRRVYKGTDGVLGRLTQLMGGSASSRVVFEILNASYRFGKPNLDGSISIGLNESDIAKRSGLSRETVNRMTRQLKSDGIIRIAGHNIEVCDINKLESAAHSA